MVSTSVKTVDEATLKPEDEVATVLFHLKKLLRLRNRLCSPLLRLPVETSIQILSYIMEDMEYSSTWQRILGTCHQIRNIMRTASELWWKANFSWHRTAKLAFMRSKGCPQAIIADLQSWDYYRNAHARKALDFCRDKLPLHGHRLHTLELCGDPSDIAHFSWIFERPLPRLDHLKIHFFRSLDEDEDDLPLQDPVALQLPTDLPLRVLDLRNATLPWSSNLFTGLSELHLDFGGCDNVVEISEDELLRILDASPHLESLSLVQVKPCPPIRGGQPHFTPTRIVQLPKLASLKLGHFPEFVGYVLAHMDTPAIVSLEIRSQVSSWEVEWSLDSFFPDDHLTNLLFPNPPVFEIGPTDSDELLDSMNVSIGGVKIRFDFDIDEHEIIRNTIVTCVRPLVPPSVAILKLDDFKLNEKEWREFFKSHPEVRSIEPSKFSQKPMPESLWDALSPAEAGVAPLCPNLESISLVGDLASTPLLNCLLSRKIAGFGLCHLKVWEADDKLAKELRLLVEVFHLISIPDPSEQKVRLVLMDELVLPLTNSQWGWSWVVELEVDDGIC